MNNLLSKLEAMTAPDAASPEYREKLDALAESLERVSAAASEELAGQLLEAVMELGGMERLEGFSRGFRLGARLGLEALRA